MQLQGVRALVTRPAGQGDALLCAIRAAGGEASALPLLEIQTIDQREPQLDQAIERLLERLEDFDSAIFISSNAVRCLFDRLQAGARSWPADLECFAIGGATAALLEARGIVTRSGTVAMNSEELLGLAPLATPAAKQIVIFKGMGGRELLATALRERGAEVTECALYRRLAPRHAPGAVAALLRTRRINTVLLNSAESLDNLLGLLGADAAGTMAAELSLVVPGVRVETLARERGFARIERADNATDGAMISALARLATRMQQEARAR